MGHHTHPDLIEQQRDALARARFSMMGGCGDTVGYVKRPILSPVFAQVQAVKPVAGYIPGSDDDMDTAYTNPNIQCGL